MTDLEITKLCAEAMGLPWPKGKLYGATPNACKVLIKEGSEDGDRRDTYYDPLHDDAQAMALVKKLQLSIAEPRAGCGWGVYRHDALRQQTSEHADLNRAICLCVASMEKAK